MGFTQCKRNYAYIGCEYLLLLCQLVQSWFLSTSAFLTGSYQFEISLIYFLPNLHIGLPDLFNECKGLGLWLWAPGELSSLIFCYCHLCHLHGIAIILSKTISLQTCRDCGARLSDCPICRQPIRNRLRVFTGWQRTNEVCLDGGSFPLSVTPTSSAPSKHKLDVYLGIVLGKIILTLEVMLSFFT